MFDYRRSTNNRVNGAILVLITTVLGHAISVRGQLAPPYRAALQGHWDGFPENYGDVWGDGHYAYICHFGDSGVHILDISDPTNPDVVAEVRPGQPNQFASAQDVQVTDHLMFIALEADGNDGVLIVDVRDPTNPVQLTRVQTPFYSNVHELYYDKGILYLAGNGPRVGMVDLTDYDIDNPPAQISDDLWTLENVGSQFVHSITVRNGRLYCCAWSSGLWVYDVTRVRTQLPTFLGSVAGQNVHTCWPTEDGKFVATGEEHTNGGIKLFQISDSQTGIVLTETDSIVLPSLDAFSVHNPIFVGDRLYVAWYQAGLQVFDLDRRTGQLELVASLDTYADPVTFFNGCWGVFPFLGSDKVLLSDIENGLFVANVGGAASITPSDLPPSLHPVYSTAVSLQAHDEFDPIDPNTVTLHRLLPSDPAADIMMSETQPSRFATELPRQKCSTPLSFYFSAETIADTTVFHPAGAPLHVLMIPAVSGHLDRWHDDFEADQGWTVGSTIDDALSGQWTRGEPLPTIAQPGHDNPQGTGTLCFFTGQASAGAPPTAGDVDRGITTLQSPAFDATGGDIGLGYAFWYSSDADGFFASDSFEVWISNNNGMTWSMLENVQDSTAMWVEKRFRISDFVTPTANMRVRFVAADRGPRSIVEAAIDDFRVFEFVCSEEPGDSSGDGFVDLSDFAGFPGCISGPGAMFADDCLIYDANPDDAIDLKDFGLIQAAFSGSP